MPWINPLRKVRCPFCFERIRIGHCAIAGARVESDGLRDAYVAEAGEELDPPPEGWRRLLAFFYVRPAYGERYVGKQAGRVCPHCHSLLPLRAEYLSDTIIGIIGTGASGKSHIVAAMIRELTDRSRLKHYGALPVDAIDESTESYYRRFYFDPLFGGNRVISGNPAVGAESPEPRFRQSNRPLIYVLRYQSPARVARVLAAADLATHRWLGWLCRDRERSVNLVFYDAPGEQLLRGTERMRYHRYVHHATARLLIVDPRILPALYRDAEPLLDEKWEPGVLEQKRRDTQSLIASVREESRGMVRWRRRHPTAVVLAKADLLHYSTLPGAKSFFDDELAREPDYSTWTDARGQSLSDRVEQLLRDAGGDAICDTARGFDRSGRGVRFFAVSATGQPDRHGQFQAVTPLHCLDPIVWILDRLDVLDVPRGVAEPRPATPGRRLIQRNGAGKERVGEETIRVPGGQPTRRVPRADPAVVAAPTVEHPRGTGTEEIPTGKTQQYRRSERDSAFQSLVRRWGPQSAAPSVSGDGEDARDG